MFPFALTIFVGAFLLFAVQPLLGKFILPWFGGSPGVWTTCLLFFQALLLGGYLYAHLTSSRLSLRRQALLHLVLIAAALACLPVIPDLRWRPEGAENPIPRILLLLGASVGLPYLVLSSTGPLIQRWFSHAHPGRSPYRLYSLSNVGSLLALLGYPFLFERFFSRQELAHYWSAGLVIYAAGAGWCAWRIWRIAPAPVAGPAEAPPDALAAAEARPAPLDRLLWFGLAAVASVLLLATTNKLCQDVAVVPFLWVLPLSLYLLSFILCFDHPRWYSRGLFSGLFALGALVDVSLLFAGHNARLAEQVIGYAGTLFAGCMLCHGELYRLRPGAGQLTSFYLSVAAGGACGGLVVAVIAPLVFDRYLELHLGLWLLSYFVGVLAFRHRSLALVFGTAAGVLASSLVVPALGALAERSDEPWTAFFEQLKTFFGEHLALIAFAAIAAAVSLVSRQGWTRTWTLRAGNFVMLFSIGLGMLLIAQVRKDSQDAVLTSRDFYGVLKVFEHNADQPDLHYYTLVHGVTSHGLQFAAAPQSDWLTTYYGEKSGLGLALAQIPPQRARHIGSVGLGTGTTAAYGRSGDRVRIYEIDPQVERLARTRFTYLARSPAKVEVVLGDARLSMERELQRGESQQFDVLALDAFSSDAIPVHLLTREAFQIYLQHLKPGGIIAVHTSNRYLDLQPVVETVASELGLHTATLSDNPSSEHWWLFRSTWVLVARRADLFESEDIAGSAEAPSGRDVAVWTDDRASVFEILK
ncbi:MAG TPA: fused MFS/spermidine synthase [Opitutus sp.]|nr:fused MFS/spermidine synthase [Opitutus sp.]